MPRRSSPETLRNEIEAITAPFIEALTTHMPPGSVTGVFGKGSAFRAWDSPIDYVPELNDVDLHVQFASGRPENEKGFDVEFALSVERATEEGYLHRISQPSHIPRLQFIPLEWIQRLPMYVPSPAGTIRSLLGTMPAERPIDPDLSREFARTLLLDQREYLIHLGDQVIDKPGHYKREVLRQMVYRVSPAGPRVLEVLGVPFVEAWSVNRTNIVQLLESIGERELSANYRAFYLHGWDYFLSAHTDNDVARALILSGAKVVSRSIEIAEQMPAP